MSREDVHIVHESVSMETLTPGHPIRTDSPTYEATHRRLIYMLDTPCYICGVRQSTLSDPAQNPFGATQMETHHYPIEWSLLDCVEWTRVKVDYPEVQSQADLEQFVDSPHNMLVLCNIHHRDERMGIHHLSVSDFFIQRYLKHGYIIATNAVHQTADEATDEAIEHTKQASA